MNAKGAYRLIPVLLATVGAIGWTAAARAGDVDYDVPKQVVKFADLNLGSLQGATALYHRIEKAAERVCGGPLDVRELSDAARLDSCKVQSIERAVDVVNSSVLTSLHLAKTGRTEKPITMAKIAQ
jgi:UrcA family protein